MAAMLWRNMVIKFDNDPGLVINSYCIQVMRLSYDDRMIFITNEKVYIWPLSQYLRRADPHAHDTEIEIFSEKKKDFFAMTKR